jgi:hypothetical protein
LFGHPINHATYATTSPHIGVVAGAIVLADQVYGHSSLLGQS